MILRLSLDIVVCQHYRRHYEQAELRRLKNDARRLHREILRLQCEAGWSAVRREPLSYIYDVYMHTKCLFIRTTCGALGRMDMLSLGVMGMELRRWDF